MGNERKIVFVDCVIVCIIKQNIYKINEEYREQKTEDFFFFFLNNIMLNFGTSVRKLSKTFKKEGPSSA